MANAKGNADVVKEYRFKPGQSGNPLGRPRKRPQSEANDERLRSLLDNATRIKMGLPVGATQADGISWMLVEKAKRGDVFAAKELRESVEGKSVQRHELGGPTETGWKVSVEYEPLGEETIRRVEEYQRRLDAKALPEPIDVAPEPERSE
jgi:Family of unknown function (DUF5681)